MSNSFPSRHTTAFFSIATVVFMFYPLLGSALLVLALLAGIGRVVLGFHWPTDVAAGLLLGTLVGYLTVLIGLPLLFT